MFRRFLPLILTVLSVLIDISVLPQILTGWVNIILTVCTVVTLGLLLGRTQGTLYGLIGGLLLDILAAYPSGVWLGICLACGYLAGIAGRKFQRNPIITVITPLLLVALQEVFMAGYLYFTGFQLTFAWVYQAAVRVLIAVVAVQILYLLFNRLLRPRWSRYSAR